METYFKIYIETNIIEWDSNPKFPTYCIKLENDKYFHNSEVKPQTKKSIVQIENMGHNIILFSITQQNYEYNPYFQLK